MGNLSALQSNPMTLSARLSAVETALTADELLLGSPLMTQGNIFYVKPFTGSNNSDGKTPATAFKTLACALSNATANQNDVVVMFAESNTAGNTTDYQSVNLAWNKDMVHLIGVNAGGASSMRSRVAPLSTAAIFYNLFTLSASGCLIQNIEFYQGAMLTSAAAAATCVTVSGSRNHFVNCQISGIGDTTLDFAGSNSLTLSGSENTFDNCYIGLDTVLRATSVTEVILSGAPARNVFRKCFFRTYTSSTAFKLITIPTTADRFTLLENCYFTAAQNITSAVVPTGVIGITTMNGTVLVMNPFVFGPAQIVTADNAYVQVLGLNGLATGHLTGIAQGVDAA